MVVLSGYQRQKVARVFRDAIELSVSMVPEDVDEAQETLKKVGYGIGKQVNRFIKSSLRYELGDEIAGTIQLPPRYFNTKKNQVRLVDFARVLDAAEVVKSDRFKLDDPRAVQLETEKYNAMREELMELATVIMEDVLGNERN